MPLPDERPRQSVANLIGRFEQQGKRQPPLAAPVVPRSSSVSSQIVGDGAKEEVKEKREWPPKPPPSADIKPPVSTLPTSPSPSMSKSPVQSPQPIPDIVPPAVVPTTPIPTSPESTLSPPSKGKAAPPPKPSSTPATRRSIASPQKHRPPVANTSFRSPPKTSLPSSVSQPLKPQHTGHSVTSNPSTARQARVIAKTTPSTPPRPKSSTGHNQPPRPKTPSSGLFAPTAASLARSRNTPPVPPPPVKKVTLSSDAAERLSKPTAASLSKARTPAPAASPARVVKPTSTSVHNSTPRGPSKIKVGRTPVKPKEPVTKGNVNSGPVTVPAEPSHLSDHPVADRVENGNGHEPGTSLDSRSPKGTHEVVSDTTYDPAEEDLHTDHGTHPEQQGGEHPVGEEEALSNDEPDEVAHEQEQEHLEAQEDPTPEPAEPHVGEVSGNGEVLPPEPRAPRNEIEDIVNLLEGASLPKPRPQSIASIPDEHDEY